ncbi:hypothetical protein GWI33_006365 [Rhynchophorus ferrugineus]|uniref:Uncharacterized protein n=1 Tax=Rhynchophorus ferrugineus TaxID=354439 RepID=A0A834IUH0_RHYFE|nr:hypothetical protein GWI33_006365 [Rhynchophorus ferrugineus]
MESIFCNSSPSEKTKNERLRVKFQLPANLERNLAKTPPLKLFITGLLSALKSLRCPAPPPSPDPSPPFRGVSARHKVTLITINPCELNDFRCRSDNCREMRKSSGTAETYKAWRGRREEKNVGVDG